MEQTEENIVKKACRELNLTQKELSVMIKKSKSSVDRWATTEVPDDIVFLLEVIIENIHLKKENTNMKHAWSTLNYYASSKGVGITNTL